MHVAHCVKENDQIADVMQFSDEANSYVDAQVNKGNCRFGEARSQICTFENLNTRKNYSEGGGEFCWDHLAFPFWKVNQVMLRL